MATQVLNRPACSLHHIAFQLIALLQHLSDMLQGRVCHTSPEEIDTTPCELSSYRPISNLSFLSKLLERVVSIQLTEYLLSAGLLPIHQIGLPEMSFYRDRSPESGDGSYRGN